MIINIHDKTIKIRTRQVVMDYMVCLLEGKTRQVTLDSIHNIDINEAPGI